jgi:hypothetical protein
MRQKIVVDSVHLTGAWGTGRRTDAADNAGQLSEDSVEESIFADTGRTGDDEEFSSAMQGG